MPKYKGICFDLDTTLANTEDSGISIVKRNGLDEKVSVEYKLYEYLSQYIRSISWEEFITKYDEAKSQIKEALVGTAASHSKYLYIQRVLELLGARFNPSIIYEATNCYWEYVLDNMALYPGVKETLELIKKNNIKVAIITDADADIQNRKLIKLGINKYIDYLVTAQEAGADKPHVKQVELALEKMNLKKDEVIVIGNNPKTDIAVAKNSHMHSILFDFDHLYEDKKDDFEQQISDFKELEKLLGLERRKYVESSLVVFDLVGTMTKERHLVSTLLAEILRKGKEDIRPSYELYKEGKVRKEEFWKSFGIEEYDEYEDRVIAGLGIDENMLKVIKDLNEKGFKLTILSNIPKEWGYAFLKKHNLGDIFPKVFFSGDLGMTKPNAKIYELLMNTYPDIDPERVFCVDDDLEDLAQGKNFLMQTVWVKNEDLDYPYVPDYVVEKPGEILGVVT